MDLDAWITGVRAGRDEYFDGIATWKVNKEGRINGIAPIELTVPNVSIGSGNIFEGLNKLTQLIKKEKAPKTIIRRDRGRLTNELPHFHYQEDCG